MLQTRLVTNYRGKRKMKLTLAKKLGLGFAVILALMVFTATMSYLKSDNIRESQDVTFELRFPSLEAARTLQRDLNQSQSKGRQTVLAGTEPARREEAKKLFDETWSDIEKDTTPLDELPPKWILQPNRDHLNQIKKQLPFLPPAKHP